MKTPSGNATEIVYFEYWVESVDGVFLEWGKADSQAKAVKAAVKAAGHYQEKTSIHLFEVARKRIFHTYHKGGANVN